MYAYRSTYIYIYRIIHIGMDKHIMSGRISGRGEEEKETESRPKKGENFLVGVRRRRVSIEFPDEGVVPE